MAVGDAADVPTMLITAPVEAVDLVPVRMIFPAGAYKLDTAGISIALDAAAVDAPMMVISPDAADTVPPRTTPAAPLEIPFRVT